MSFNIIVLDYNEKFVKSLNPNLVNVTENTQIGGIRSIPVEYSMQNLDDARKLFKAGNKLWITGHPNIEDCLYVINSEVKRDYFKENKVTFDAEDVIVELNNAPLFSQTDLTAANGFTLSTSQGETNVKVDYNALKFWFGDYFNIGVVQDCLSPEISKISPTGTMTKMELLRYIEKETCNVFVPRYEKDVNSNVIHRYLDFLNPNGTDRNWEITFEYAPVPNEVIEENPISEYADVQNKDDIVIFPEYTPPVQHLAENIRVSIKNQYGEVIDALSWSAEELGMDNNVDNIEIKLKYNKPTLTATINNKTYTSSAPVDTAGGHGGDDTLLTTVSQDTELNSNIIIPNNSYFEVYDIFTDDLLYKHEINPSLGDVHTEVLDLGYNVNNIECDINEGDTFNAISPILSLDQNTNSNALTRDDMSTLINNWRNLSISKGDKIPMIVQRVSMDLSPTTQNLNRSSVDENYYSRPLKPNDNADNNEYEYWRATAYWYAPFDKVAGEMHIETTENNGADYTTIRTRPDIKNPYGAVSTPKMGTVSTTDEDKYAIYNDVALKLKEKMYPSVSITVDVANYRNGEYNNYKVYDKVYVKVPGFEGLITAIVSKTTKSAHDMTKNTVTLENFSVNTKVSTKSTMIIGDNLNLKYPYNNASLPLTLVDITGETNVPLSNKLINFALYKVTDGISNFRKTYAKVTNENGVATLSIGLNPGDYVIEASFVGDVEYTESNASFDINIAGTITTTPTAAGSGTSTTTKTETTYYDKYGRSPDKKKILAIGKISAGRDTGSYANYYGMEFKNKCPHCGKEALVWGIFWAGEHTNYGYFDGTKAKEGGSIEGHVFCTHCDADYSCQGNEHVSNGKKLTSTKSKFVSSKNDAYKLRNGKYVYETKTVTVAATSNAKKTARASPKWSVDKKVKEWALKKVGSSEGIAAAKKLAEACGKIRYDSYNDFNRSPTTVLNKGGGNCCDQTRLFLMACDAVGVSHDYDFKYVFVCCSKGGVGHVFARLIDKKTNNKTYVDPCKTSGGGPWGHYVTGWGSPPGRETSYPTRPF